MINSPMRFSLNAKALEEWDGDILIFGILEDQTESGFALLKDRYGEKIITCLDKQKFTGKKAQIATFHPLADLPEKLISVVGIGKSDSLNAGSFRKAASQAAQEASTEVASLAQAAAQDAQQAALDALWELESMPGSTGMHTLEVTAAIRQAQAEMHGNDFNYMGHSSYEAAMEAFAAAEAAGKNQSDLVNEVEGDHDPNRMGKCGKASC